MSNLDTIIDFVSKNLRLGVFNQLSEKIYSSNVKINEVFSFIYRAYLNNSLIEYEYDHVLIGYSDVDPKVNIDEVEDWKWMDLKFIEEDLNKNSNIYTEWFKIIFKKVKNYIHSSN